MIKLAELLSEIDWEKDYPDTKKQCIPLEVVKDMLQKQLDWSNLTAKEKKAHPEMDVRKRNVNIPIITPKNIPTTDKGIDVDHFIKQITAKPDTIFEKNPKMERSDKGGYQYTVNTGVPALRGIVYSEKEKKFYIINTCPGAGSCIRDCFAREGQYMMNKGKNLKYIQRLNLLLNNPKEYEELIMDELDPEAYKIKRQSNKEGTDIKLVIRWNDAGDFFSKRYFDVALSVTNRLLKEGYNIESYAYTKVGDIANIADPNFLMTFSTDATKREKEKVDLSSVKSSPIVPKSVYKNYLIPKGSYWELDNSTGKPLFRDADGREKLRAKIWSTYHKEYGIDYDSIVYTDELPSKQGEKFQYNVIVMPQGDNDVAPQRRDVKVTFNLEH